MVGLGILRLDGLQSPLLTGEEGKDTQMQMGPPPPPSCCTFISQELLTRVLGSARLWGQTPTLSS